MDWMNHKLESALLGEISITSDLQITLPYDRKQREIEESLAPWRKSCGKPWQHIEKERHHFADKGLYSQSYDFSSSHVWMWELNHTEGWVLKSWFFSTVVLEKTLESPLDSKEIQPVHPKEINPDYSLEGLMLKLKLHSFGYLMRRTESMEKTLILWNIEGRRRRGQQRTRWLDDTINSADISLSNLSETVKDREAWFAAFHWIAESRTQLSN